jgi:hydrogenase/urease accessory protein HupE
VLAVLAVFHFSSPAARAHPEGFSGLRVIITRAGDDAHAVLTLHTRDMTRWFPPRNYPDYVADVCNHLAADPAAVLELRAEDQLIAGIGARAFSPEVGMIELDVDYLLPRGARVLQIWSKHLVELPVGHQQLLFVEQQPTSTDAQPVTLCEDTLTIDHSIADVELPAMDSSSLSTFAMPPTAAPRANHISFFALGVEHIVTGYDHLLFLAALLLVCTSFRQAASVVTLFTVAHSITLTLAALNLVRLPARIVEPAIAASIVYVGLENIFGRHRVLWRAMVTFGFGLVHGLGFASALREVGLGSTNVGLAMPLLKFSVGLETGQLVIAAVFLQLLLWLRRRRERDATLLPSPILPSEPRWVPAGSMLVSLIGAYWLVVRVMAG